MMQDCYGRNINYLRISVTDLCNLRCRYCMPVQGVCKKSHESILKLEEIAMLAQEFVFLGIDKIRITGGEPLIRKGILTLVESIAGINGLKDFAMTTNGTLLKKYAKDLKLAGLKRLNISLDTLNQEKYAYMTRGGRLKDVLEGIEEAQKADFHPIKINVVLIKEFNQDEVDNFIDLTKHTDIDVRFIELMSIGEAAAWADKKFISNQEILDRREDLVRIAKKDIASPADYYQLPGGVGRIGFISPLSCKFCENCNRIRVTADGKMKHCLHSDEEINLREFLSDRKLIRKVISDAVFQKPMSHHLEDGKYIARNMVQIGG